MNKPQASSRANDPQVLGDVVILVRNAFQLLRKTSDHSLADLGLTASMRAVLEHVHRNGPQSVPQIAKAKHMARQSAQELIDPLVERGMLEALPNPRHKKSPLLDMTEKGRQIFATINERDRAMLADVAASLPELDLAAVRHSLDQLCACLERALPENESEKGDGR